MFIRAVALFCILILSTGVALQSLVHNHVRNVAIAHAKDKSLHNTDMIERIDALDSIFAQSGVETSVLSRIQNMAHDSDILEMFFYDTSGALILVTPDNPLAAQDATHAHNPTLQPGPDLDFNLSAIGHSHTPEPTLMQENGHSNHTAHGGSDTALPLPPANLHTHLTHDRSSPNQSFEFTSSHHHSSIVTAIVPVKNKSGEHLGYARYQVDVGDVMEAYASGLGWFATVLVIFGATIFSVPALGYFIQRRIADRSNSNAEYLASFDALTGLLNRRGFMSRAEAQLETLKTANIAYLDVDRFKNTNDTYGHAIGDALLQNISRKIKKIFPDTAITTRLGGDEFVVIDTTTNKEDFSRLLERLREGCAKEINLNGITIRSSVSIGFAPYTAGKSLESSLQDADLALYFAKAEGGDSVSIYDPKMADDMIKRRALEARLKQAVKDSDFKLHYQPLIDSQSLKISGYEALLRLKDDDGNMISPADFIPLSESMGLIEEIGTWVLYTATREISEMSSKDMVAINLSPEQFKSGNLVSIVEDALKRANLPASRLELEITESLLLDNSTDVAMQIDALKDMGVSIAMDDFGTGFSSLSYLWKFGFDRIKIDRSFIHALEEDTGRSLGLIESIIILGKKLNMRITAEGIETQNQSDILSSLGCDVLQGFFYGRPEPLTLTNAHQNQDQGRRKAG